MAETCPNCDLARAFPARLGLALFAWILTLHPTAAGRVEAAYGGVYSSAAILWLLQVGGTKPSLWDVIDHFVTLCGIASIETGHTAIMPIIKGTGL
ncbi:hypothetical protein [Pseudomonas sp.]|uniref:hypothetical protein n=1 Tax=Pseudomonas sp. TaxID=306 RepID=UPI00390C6110